MEVKKQILFKVNIIESERGWGSKIDETKYFDNHQEALDFVKTYNSKNNLEQVPEWYMYASYEGQI